MFGALFLGVNPIGHLLFQQCETDWIIHATLLGVVWELCAAEGQSLIFLCVCFFVCTDLAVLKIDQIMLSLMLDLFLGFWLDVYEY